MKLNIFLCMYALLIVLGGCQMISQNVDEMTESEYNRVQREIYLITKIISREIFKTNPVLKEQVGIAMNILMPSIGEYVKNGVFLDKLVEQIDDPEIKELVELIMLEIGKYGGFKYIDEAKSILDIRSAGLLTQVVFAIIDAANE